MKKQTLTAQRRESILKAEREKDQVTCKNRPIIIPGFSMETLKTRKTYIDGLQALRDYRWKARYYAQQNYQSQST